MVQEENVVPPYIVHVSTVRGDWGKRYFEEHASAQIAERGYQPCNDDKSVMTYLEEYPVVYIVHADAKDGKKPGTSIVYVGETNDIVRRTQQHLDVDPRTREDWKSLAERDDTMQYVIANKYFNKSLTLDVETNSCTISRAPIPCRRSTIAAPTRRAGITRTRCSSRSSMTSGSACTMKIRSCSLPSRSSSIQRCSKRRRSTR